MIKAEQLLQINSNRNNNNQKITNHKNPNKIKKILLEI